MQQQQVGPGSPHSGSSPSAGQRGGQAPGPVDPRRWSRRAEARRLGRLARRAACLAGLLLLTHPVAAQTVSELRAQLNMLQRRIDQLEAAQRRSDQRGAEAQRAAARSSEAPAGNAAQNAVQNAAPAPAREAQAAAPARRGAPSQASSAAASDSSSRNPGNQTPPNVTSALPVQAQREDSTSEWRGSFPGSFRVPGTNTSVRLYGFAKLNMIGDLGPRNRSDALTGQSIPLDRGAGGGRSDGDFQASARRSRLGIETRTGIDDSFGEVRTQVEFDFAGQNADLTTQATSNSYTPRLRQAFAEFGQFQDGGWGTVLVGQSNSLFAETPLVPLQWLDDWSPLALSNVRQAQVRYSRHLGDGITVKAALENSYSDITSTTGTSYPDSNGGAGFGINQVPDLTGQAILQGDWGFAALRGVLRQIRISNNGAATAAARYTDSALGYGIGATGAVHLLDKRLVLTGSVNYGEGLGRYLDTSSAGYGAVSNVGLAGTAAADRGIDTVDVLSAMVGMQYHYTANLRSNVSLHGVRLNYPDYVRSFSGCAGAGTGTVCDGVNRNIWAGVVNLIWSPVKPIDLGIEYTHIERTLENRDVNGVRGGQAHRIQASAIVRF